MVKIVYFTGIFLMFYLFKDDIVDSSLSLITKLQTNSSNNDIEQIRQYKVREIEGIFSENKELKKSLNLKVNSAKKFVVGRVLTNIYASSFWVEFSDCTKIHKGSAVWSNAMLIGFIIKIKSHFALVRPIIDPRSKFTGITKDSGRVVLKGAGRYLELVLKESDEHIKDKDLVFFEDSLKIGTIYGKIVLPAADFGRVKWVYVTI
jgi:cell shape-determining protein MreC